MTFKFDQKEILYLRCLLLIDDLVLGDYVTRETKEERDGTESLGTSKR